LDAARNLDLQKLQISQGALGLTPANLGGTTSQPVYQNAASNIAGVAMAAKAFGLL
jgi:hypothetical protein